MCIRDRPLSKSLLEKTSPSSVPVIFLLELSSVSESASSLISSIRADPGASKGALSSSEASLTSIV